ncbi:hypothetical protein RSOCI_06020 [Rhabdochlamydiaceae symbiont of Dictyostelium giganteum]
MMIIDYIHLESINSTNTFAKENALHFHPHHLTCITALEQTAGRGRYNRKWISPKDKNLYLSLFLTLPSYLSYILNLGQIMAMACHEMLLEKGITLMLKWPNDLLLDYRKIGGILTETVVINQRVGVVIGLGLNVNLTKEEYAHIDQPVTSLCEWTGTLINPSTFVEPLLKHFTKNLELLMTHGFEPFLPYFKKYIAYQGKSVTLKLPQGPIQGICHSLLPDGSLQLLLPSGTLQTVSMGEIIMHSAS